MVKCEREDSKTDHNNNILYKIDRTKTGEIVYRISKERKKEIKRERERDVEKLESSASFFVCLVVVYILVVFKLVIHMTAHSGYSMCL